MSLTAPEYDASALITIDVQTDTLDGQPLEVAGTSAALPAMARLAAAFRAADRPIVHVVRLYLADGSNAEPARTELTNIGVTCAPTDDVVDALREWSTAP
jgi:nicotinamidase-related amidase